MHAITPRYPSTMHALLQLLPLVLLSLALTSTSLASFQPRILSPPSSSSLLPPSSPSACPINNSWSFSFPDSTFIRQLYRHPTACQIILAQNSSTPPTVTLWGVDLLTGRLRWSFSMPCSDMFTSLPKAALLASPTSPSRLYLLDRGSASDGGCRVVRGVQYDVAAGLSPLWNTTICGGIIGDTALLAFPSASATDSSTSGATAAAASTDVLLLVEGASYPHAPSPSTWSTLDGVTGTILQQQLSVPLSAATVGSWGEPTERRFFVVNATSGLYASTTVLSFELDTGGTWRQLANITFASFSWRLPFSLPQLGYVLSLQGAFTQGDHWTGWDLLTGKQLWAVEGDALFTGKWAAPFPGFQQQSAPTGSVHPLDPALLLFNACAYNASLFPSFAVCQYGILDTATGHVSARSAVTAPLFAAKGFNLNLGGWTAVDNATVALLMGGDWQRLWWRALDATTLTAVSTGQVNGPAFGLLSLSNTSVAVWWETFTGNYSYSVDVYQYRYSAAGEPQRKGRPDVMSV